MNSWLITKGKMMLCAVALCAAFWQALPLVPAQARLDELIRPGAPYLAAPAVTATETDAAAGTAVPRVHIVHEGETLSGIASRYGIDQEKLAQINNLRDIDRIIKGQALLLPGSAFPYRVRRGENLSLIACRFGIDQEKLAQINNLRDIDRIIKGQALLLPGSAFPYRVRRGENLSLIACRFGISQRELVEMNDLADPDRLLAGQEIMIPAGQGGGSMPASRALPLGQLQWPVVGWISSPYGIRDGTMHEGIDIAANYGQIVRAAKEGRVVFAGPRGTYGKTVIIDHGGGLRTLYAHNSQLLVRPGQRVLAGQPIARVGSTGRSTGPHLHLEVLLNGIPFDPLLCLQGSGLS